jgi:tetratricopeptide (TPR) repeat protein
MNKAANIFRPFLVLLLLAAGVVEGPTSHAAEKHQVFYDGIRDYKNGNYPEAIEAFLKIIHEGVHNSKLYYNLGNAYLKNDQLGPAMLWYEKARRLNPRDPDLNFNHDYALSLLKDARDEKELPWEQIFLFWKQLLPPNLIQWAAVSFNLLFWSLLLLSSISKKKGYRISSLICLALTVIFTLTAGYSLYEGRFNKEGIILPEQVSVRSGLTEDATELFVLHGGTKVNIKREQQGYVRIYFSNGKIGWVSKTSIGII